MAQPIYEYIVTQNAESCLIYCKANMVPDIEARDIITEASKIFCIKLKQAHAGVS